MVLCVIAYILCLQFLYAKGTQTTMEKQVLQVVLISFDIAVIQSFNRIIIAFVCSVFSISMKYLVEPWRACNWARTFHIACRPFCLSDRIKQSFWCDKNTRKHIIHNKKSLSMLTRAICTYFRIRTIKSIVMSFFFSSVWIQGTCTHRFVMCISAMNKLVFFFY